MNAKERREFFSCGLSDVLAAGKFARPGSEPSYAPDQQFDARHILLEFALDIPRKSAKARCTTVFQAIADGAREIRFDAVGMRVLRVAESSGRKVRHKYHKDTLSVHLTRPASEGETVTVRVDYGRPDWIENNNIY